MGRNSQIPQLEEKLGGVNLKTWLTERIKEGKKPAQLADLMEVSKSQAYDLINEFNLKDVLKSAQKAITTGIQGELKDLFEEWCKYLEVGNRSPRSIKNLRANFKCFFWWLEEFKRPCTIANYTSDTLNDFLYYCKTTTVRFGGLVPGSRRPIKAVSLKAYRVNFHTFGEYLIMRQKIERNNNPADLIPQIKIEKREPEDLKDEVIARILNSFDESTYNGLLGKTIILMFLGTGMRMQGVEELKRDTFNMETGEGKIIEKGNKERPIVLVRPLREQLKRYLQERDLIAGDNEWLWVDNDGKRFTRSMISSLVRSLKRFDKKIHPHLFRKIFAKTMFEQEVPIQYIMTMGGWESTELVQHYARSYSKRVHWAKIDQYSPLRRFLGEAGEAPSVA